MKTLIMAQVQTGTSVGTSLWQTNGLVCLRGKSQEREREGKNKSVILKDGWFTIAGCFANLLCPLLGSSSQFSPLSAHCLG